MVWVSGLKYVDTFALHALTCATIIASFCLMLIAVKRIEVSVAYSIFVGLGTADVVLSEICIFKEPLDMLKIIFIATLLLGVIGLKFVSKKDNEKITSNLSQKIRLDDVMQDSTKMSWALLVFAGIMEIFGAFTLKKFANSDKKIYLLAIAFLFVISFSALSIVMREIPLGVAYAVWTGIGSAEIVIVGIVFFKESKKAKQTLFP